MGGGGGAILDTCILPCLKYFFFFFFKCRFYIIILIKSMSRNDTKIFFIIIRLLMTSLAFPTSKFPPFIWFSGCHIFKYSTEFDTDEMSLKFIKAFSSKFSQFIKLIYIFMNK